MSKIKVGDQVYVVAGKDKGKKGAVLKVLNRQQAKTKISGAPSVKVIVEGVNLVKKHTRANPQMEKPGGIIEKEMPIDISNVQYLGADGKPSRLGIKWIENRKVRYCKSNQEVIDA